MVGGAHVEIGDEEHRLDDAGADEAAVDLGAVHAVLAADDGERGDAGTSGEIALGGGDRALARIAERRLRGALVGGVDAPCEAAAAATRMTPRRPEGAMRCDVEAGGPAVATGARHLEDRPEPGRAGLETRGSGHLHAAKIAALSTTQVPEDLAVPPPQVGRVGGTDHDPHASVRKRPNARVQTLVDDGPGDLATGGDRA